MLIGQLAQISGLSKDGIRHYEALGLIRSTPRQAGSRLYRDYDAAALTRIEHIREAQMLGLSLKEIGSLLDAFDLVLPEDAAIRRFLTERLEMIRSQIAALRRIEDLLGQKLAAQKAGGLAALHKVKLRPAAASAKAASHQPSLGPRRAR